MIRLGTISGEIKRHCKSVVLRMVCHFARKVPGGQRIHHISIIVTNELLILNLT